MLSFIRCNTKILRIVVPRIQQSSGLRFKSNLAADAQSCSLTEWAAKATNADWENVLTPEQYFVCREGGTEQPFTGINFSNFDEGVYRCVCCSSTLFSSEAKYDSGYGWPSFHWAEKDGPSCSVMQRQDTGIAVTQVLCSHCESQLGHILQDSNDSSMDCYCINSEALQFEPK
ncbi:peptide methionine sulfoxide reductase MsrB-like [Antedon mediterranea]|uniref:peptide methionine sulfoxide reductase MsrB-like n=1 Tax=Antedon mediterranea TaxID=105859 RepID=UPI003AF69C19